ncbi:hypothetical protein SCUCBS95973_009615 [Sporothrix curviconia]|uniref:C2H2 type master regulator of conidiophore development brlA n=1 Tax=Sporothrix curviconia TaxID=1260050 RepID=A0ABP0CY29_9PEZI
MAPSPSAGHIVARSVSHGKIAGAVVGSVLGFLLIFILVLPFILRAFRDRRYHKKIKAENEAMGITGQGFYGGPPGQQFHPLFYEPPADTTAGTDGAAAPSQPDPASKIVGDNNSSEDGKTAVAGSPPSSSAGGGPQTVVAAADAAPPAADAPVVAAPPRAALAPVPAPINTNIPPYNGPHSASMAGPPYPTLNAAATFSAFGSHDPMSAPRQRSATMRSTRSTSLSQKMETIAGRAAAVFRQGSTRSSPSRSPTIDSSRSPVELSSNNRYPQVDHHTWLMRQQGIDDESTGVSPGFFEVNTQYLTGASAEYYSGAPLSPPTDPNSHLMSPTSYAPEPPSMIATSLASMASAAAVAGVAGGSKKQKKPPVSRTDSIRTAATGEDFSPLPLSPTSPLPAVHEGSRGIKQEAPSPAQTSERGISSPPTGPGMGMSTKELTPDTVDFSAHSPAYRPLVPSPQLPAPGTVNPRDVWAPATDDERFIHRTAELDRFEQSPPPALSNEQAGPAVFMQGAENQDLGVKTEAELEEASGPVEASPKPVSTPQASPGVPVAEHSYAAHAQPVPTSADALISTPAQPDTVVPDVVDTKFTPRSIEDKTPPATTQDFTTNTGGGQLNDEDFDELMRGLDDQGGYNFAFGENQQAGYIPDLTNDINVNINPTPQPNSNANSNLNLDLNNFNNFNSAIDTNQNIVNHHIPVTLDGGINSGSIAGTHNGIHPGPDGMGAYSLGGVTGANGVYQSMPQQGAPTYWNLPNMQNMPSNNVPTIAGPFMTPVTQPDYPNGILGAPFTVSSNMPDGINGANSMHMTDYGKDNVQQYSLQTPQSSPGQLSINLVNGTLPPGMVVPLTPSPQRLAPSFNSPLSVPGSSAPSRPMSPSSNQGSTPGQSSSTSPRTFACEECGRIFDQVHKLNHHKRYHERPHECTFPDCGKRFGTRTHLDRHVNDKHSKSRKYHCTEEGCPYSVPGGKSFPRKDNWRRHMVNKHGVHPEHEPIEVVDQPMAYT